MVKFSRVYNWRTEEITIEENGNISQRFIDNRSGVTFKTWNTSLAECGWKHQRDYINRLKELNFSLVLP